MKRHRLGQSRSPARTLCWTAAIVLIAAATAWAGQTTAAIRVRLVGATSAKASMEVLADAAPQRRWTTPLEPSGTTSLRGLPPGRYRATVTFASNGSTASLELSAGAGEIVAVDVLTTPAGGPEIRVVHRDPIDQRTVFNAQQLRDLPAGDSVWALLDTAAPLVVVDRFDNGGLATGASALVGSRGSSWTDTSVFLGGSKVLRDAVGGATAFYPDLRTVEEVVVTSGGAPVEFGTPGTTVTLTPRRPTATRWARSICP